MFPAIAITLGILIVISRIPLLIWPEQGRRYTGTALQLQPVTSVLGLLMIALGALIAYAAVTENYPMEFVMWVVGATSFLLGVVAVVAPHVPRQLWDSLVFHRHMGMVRASAALGVLIGLSVLGLGLTWLGEQSRLEKKAVQMQGIGKDHNMLLEGEIQQLRQVGEHNTNQIVQMKTTIEKLEREINKLRQTLESVQPEGEPPSDDESLLESTPLLRAT